MLTLSEAGCIVWRNETSGAYVGKVIHKAAQQVTLTNARLVRFGLCTGSSDLIGIAPSGRFLAVEIKTAKGRASAEQSNFIERVRQAGGVAGIVRSPEDAIKLLEEAGE
jgi:hypothetical protein